MMEGMEVLTRAIDELVAVAEADGESLVALRRQIDRLEAVAARWTARSDASGEWAPAGAKTCAAWLAWRCHTPVADARRRVRLARELRHLPHTEAAWLAGDVNERHVAKLAAARNPVTQQHFARDEATLVDHAKTMSYADFARTVDYWSQHADPDGVEDLAQRQHDSRAAHLDQSFQGMWFGKLLLDPISGTIVSNALKQIEDELFAADWAEAVERLGRRPIVTELRRTPAQRRADAFVELATRAMSTPPGSRRPKPLFTVLVGYETLKGRICELANRTVVTPGSLVPWLTEADVERAVFDPRGRVIDVGEQRCFTGATRRAVQLQGQECFHETCETPAEDCEADHVEPAAWGGPTRTWNGRPACGYHNRRRARGP
jgi:hypothetical protein